VRGEGRERVGVDGGFGEPYPFRLAAEAPAKISDSPEHLRLAVAGVGERQDHVAVGLRHRRTVAGKALLALPVRLEHGAIDRLRVGLEPSEKSRPEVEAHPRVVARKFSDDLGSERLARCRVGCVTLGCDTRVPARERRGGGLRLDGPRPRILPRRLIEVAVDAEESAQTSPSLKNPQDQTNSSNGPAVSGAFISDLI